MKFAMNLGLAVALLISGAAQAEMVTMKWPEKLRAAKLAEEREASSALTVALASGDPVRIANIRNVTKTIGIAYHFDVIKPTEEDVIVPDFAAKALAKQGLVVADGKDHSNLDVRAALQVAPYDELVAFLTARGVGRKLFRWYASRSNQMPIDQVRSMALVEFDKAPE